MALRKETVAECLERASYARARASTAKGDADRREWEVIAAEWMAEVKKEQVRAHTASVRER